MALSDYFQYEADLAGTHLAPLLSRCGVLRKGLRALDVGCGYGGTLSALSDAVPDLQGDGVELDPAMIAEGTARLRHPDRIRLSAGNLFGWTGGPYDLILMRDVLEHIMEPERALAHAVTLLKPDGFVFASFAPFLGPFGGHQHNGSGWFSALPWAQLLPEKIFRGMLTVEGNSYKARLSLNQDMESVLSTRLTLRRFRKGIRDAGLFPLYQAAYLSRPDYRVKFGWPALRFPAIPMLEEFFCTGVESILQLGLNPAENA